MIIPPGSLRRSKIGTAFWVAWGLGTLLVVLSWMGVVSPLMGWAGFFIGFIAMLVYVIHQIIVRSRQLKIKSSQQSAAKPEAVTFTEELIQIRLADGRLISTRLNRYPKLAKASITERAEHELGENGIYWPGLEVDISIWDVLGGMKSEQL